MPEHYEFNEESYDEYITMEVVVTMDDGYCWQRLADDIGMPMEN